MMDFTEGYSSTNLNSTVHSVFKGFALFLEDCITYFHILEAIFLE